METMERAQRPQRIEPAHGPSEREMAGLCQRYRILGWTAGILAVAAFSLSAWLMVQMSARCALRETRT
jgi:hypothetical protein